MLWRLESVHMTSLGFTTNLCGTPLLSSLFWWIVGSSTVRGGDVSVLRPVSKELECIPAGSSLGVRTDSKGLLLISLPDRVTV